MWPPSLQDEVPEREAVRSLGLGSPADRAFFFPRRCAGVYCFSFLAFLANSIQKFYVVIGGICLLEVVVSSVLLKFVSNQPANCAGSLIVNT